MQALQNRAFLSSEPSAMAQLQDFLRQRREAHAPVENLDAVEQELHRLFVAAEREALRHELARFDLDVPVVEVDGERYHQVLRCATTYTSAAGPVRVERSLYRPSQGGPTLCPLELRAGIIEGVWTPLALSVHWETHRPRFEATLRDQETLPAEAVTMAVSLDGVMAPMKDGERHTKRTQAVAAGKTPSGPAGYQEVGCATVSYYDRAGNRLLTRRMARMPETNKRTLKSQLTAEVMGALTQQPALRIVKVADGAGDNWSYLGE